jgi:hypothetical protein
LYTVLDDGVDNGPTNASGGLSPHVDENTKPSKRPLILYAYFETENARRNLEFFIAHALHDAADFIFILNGETNATDLLPKTPNIRYLHRANDCYDLGAYAEVLLKDDLYKKYQRFIMMNASIRGPFLPYYATGCWSDMYLSRITDEVKVRSLCLISPSVSLTIAIKLVGMSMNCGPVPHVQAMMWATDRVGLELLLFPTESQTELTKASIPPLKDGGPIPPLETAGINWCPHEYWEAVSIEVYSTPLMEAAGYKVDVIMSAFHKQERFQDQCSQDDLDPLWEGQYFGTTMHPFDTVFAKANRGIGALVMERLTEWTDGRKYSSYDYCH